MQHYVSYYKLASKATIGHNQLTEKINLFTYFRSLITDMKINLSFKLQNTALCKRFAKPRFNSAKHEIPFCIGLQVYGSNSVLCNHGAVAFEISETCSWITRAQCNPSSVTEIWNLKVSPSMQGEQTLSFPFLYCVWIVIISILSFQTVFFKSLKSFRIQRATLREHIPKTWGNIFPSTSFTDNREHKTASLISCPSAYCYTPANWNCSSETFLTTLGQKSLLIA